MRERARIIERVYRRAHPEKSHEQYAETDEYVADDRRAAELETHYEYDARDESERGKRGRLEYPQKRIGVVFEIQKPDYLTRDRRSDVRADDNA